MNPSLFSFCSRHFFFVHAAYQSGASADLLMPTDWWYPFAHLTFCYWSFFFRPPFFPHPSFFFSSCTLTASWSRLPLILRIFYAYLPVQPRDFCVKDRLTFFYGSSTKFENGRVFAHFFAEWAAGFGQRHPSAFFHTLFFSYFIRQVNSEKRHEKHFLSSDNKK